MYKRGRWLAQPMIEERCFECFFLGVHCWRLYRMCEGGEPTSPFSPPPLHAVEKEQRVPFLDQIWQPWFLRFLVTREQKSITR